MGVTIPPALVTETIGSKLRRARYSARLNNPHDAAPLIAPTSWTNGELLSTPGRVRVSTNSLYYMNVSTGTCGATAPSHLTAQAISDGGVIWEFIGGPIVATTGAEVPTVVDNTGSGSAPSGLTALPMQAHASTLLSLRGCYSVNYVTNGFQFYRFNRDAIPTRANGKCSQRFICDAPLLGVSVVNGTYGFGLFVDGRPTKLDFLGAGMSGNNFVTLQWQCRKWRKYELVWPSSQSALVNMATAPADTMFADTQGADLSGVFIGDSYLDGSNYSPFLPGRSLGEVFGRKIGVDFWIFATGGTGWTNPGTGPYFTYGQRIAEALTRNPKIWVIYGSTNDLSANASAMTAAVLSGLQAIRAGGSTAPIVLIGPNPLSAATLTATLQTEAAIQAAVTAFNDPLTFFFPSASADLPMTLGSYNNSTWNAVFNNSYYIISGDGTHPAEIGVRNFAERWAWQYDTLVLPYLA